MMREQTDGIAEALAGLAESIGNASPSPELERTLVRAYRERRRRRARRTWWRFLGAAAAAAALAVTAMVSRPDPEPPAARLMEEVATDYMPVGFARPLRADEYVQVVRISLPRNEMARFGLPVSPAAGAEPVEADVILGEDGVARAIRFVR
jgi:hypothetical protein